MPCQHDRARTLARRCFLVVIPFLLIGIGAALFPTSGYATTAAGRTKGTFAVNQVGAATYTIPIWAPPGPQGMQPHIALTYNSQQGNGYVGVGWSVSRLSSIYRCNLTYAQDAAPAAVALVTGDGYCMDGQRLRLTGGTYGEAGSTYQTEVANFENVTAYGAAGNGPAYFIVQDRNGRSYYYGDSTSSQVLATDSMTALSWQLNEVTDPAGNTMTIAYNTATGSAVPAMISWTPSSSGSSTYNYTMTFAYGTNVVPPQGYVGGTSFKNPNLLSSISIAYSSTAVKTYYLTYQASPTTGRDELTQVQECAGAGTSNCLSPTTITYQSGTAGVSTTATAALGTGTQTNLYVNYDFNGDGYKDIVYCGSSGLYVAFGSASGYGTPVSTGIGCGDAVFGDVLGTGTDGILAPNGSTWYYYTWNGSSFTGTSTGLAFDSTAAQYLLADVNGDGLPDLISTYFTSSCNSFCVYTETVYTRLNTSSGSTPSFSSTKSSAYATGSRYLAGAQVQAVQQ
jgi:virulence plasmid B protein